jgi:hypothetical protein
VWRDGSPHPTLDRAADGTRIAIERLMRRASFLTPILLVFATTWPFDRAR